MESIRQTVKAATAKIAGFDFGLKDFLTESDGSRVAAPQPLKQSLKQMKNASRDLSRKSKISNNRKKARRTLALLHRRISNQRKDFHYKLAALLVRQNQHICIEDLNIQGMKALWGRKVSDKGFASFVWILNTGNQDRLHRSKDRSLVSQQQNLSLREQSIGTVFFI